MKPKRRNLTRWQENRLRRLVYKLDALPLLRSLSYGASMNDHSPESEARCRDRANELRSAVQSAKFRAASDALMVGFAATYAKLAQ